MTAYAALDPARVIETIERLRARIAERFPASGLAKVCSDLATAARRKRARAIAALQEIRGLVHVIDMHQLTKDPGMLGGARTSASPERDLTPFELSRYLDYCSEMLSLAANLSQKIWQKITILRTSGAEI